MLSCLFTIIFFLFISGRPTWQQHLQGYETVAIKEKKIAERKQKSIAEKKVYIFYESKLMHVGKAYYRNKKYSSRLEK